MAAYEQLQISFFLYIQGKFLSEYTIAKQLSQLKKIANSKEYNLPTMDGAISILYKGEELLGEAYPDEILTVHVDTPGFLEGKSCETYLPLAGHFMYFNPINSKLEYELKTAKGTSIKLRNLPLLPFIKKYNYMKYRLIRLKAYFTNTKENAKKWESWGYGTEKWKNIVGVDKINAIMNGEIYEVLTEGKYRK